MKTAVGGVKNIYVFNPAEITVKYYGKLNEVCKIIIPKQLKDYVIKVVSQSVNVVVDNDDDDNAGSYEIAISGTVSRTNISSREILQPLKKKCVILVEDMNNQMFLFGDHKNHLTPEKFSRTTPDKVASLSAYSFAVGLFSLFEPPIVQEVQVLQ